jgi:hypothetical protein
MEAAMLESFWYNGWQYFQQGRRCGKPGCGCAEGEVHGPYWYRRRKSGQREYIGRELDRRLRQAVELRDSFIETLAHHVAVMHINIELLDSVMRGERELSLEDQHRLEVLGYPMLMPWEGGRD